MDKYNRDRGKQPDDFSQAATLSGPKPGDFSLGSLQSRAAARCILEQRIRPSRRIRFLMLMHRPPWAGAKETEREYPDSEFETVWIEDMTPEEKAEYPCDCQECRETRREEQEYERE
jgi:hypothetical protein